MRLPKIGLARVAVRQGLATPKYPTFSYSEVMESRLAIVIAVNGLRASALGTYGNTAFSTPNFDKLASRSLVIERLFAESPQIDSFNLSAWDSCVGSKTRKWFVTDVSLASQLAHDWFDEIVLMEEPGIGQRASETDETHTATFLATAMDQLATWQKDIAENGTSGLIWIHFSGLCGPWDAPIRFREEFMEEGDPQVSGLIVPPSDLTMDDPDELLRIRVAYAAQIAVLDSYLAAFIEGFDALAQNKDWLSMIVGTGGFSLGEHGKVGHQCDSLYVEQVHLPWLLFRRGSNFPRPRFLGFARPKDVGITLSDWFLESTCSAPFPHSLVSALEDGPIALRDRATSLNARGMRAIRTPAWMLLLGDSVELYSKPDDYWEANNVANLCPEIVELLSQCLQTSNDDEQPLPPQLYSNWR